MTLTYVYGNGLYVNLTNRCCNRCEFCLRTTGDKVGDSGSLWLEREATTDELWESIKSRNLDDYKELVFCGYGEPTYRLDVILELCRRVKEISNIKTRLNTNGLADLINKKETAPLLKGLMDAVSISLNASTPEKYDELCHSIYGLKALPEILRYTKEVEKYVPYVRMTVVDTMPEDELEACRKLCKETGADFVIRHYETDWTE